MHGVTTKTLDTVRHLTFVTDAHCGDWLCVWKEDKVGSYSDSPTDGATVPSHIVCSVAISMQVINPTTASMVFKVSIFRC